MLLVDGVFEGAAARDGAGEATGEAGGFEFVGGGAEDGLGGAELGEELAGFAGAEAGDEAEGEPVEFVFLGEGGGRHW